MKNPKLHHEYRVEFLDHAGNSDEPMKAVLWGRLAAITPEALTFDVWGHMDPTHSRAMSDDIECYTIVRSTISALYELIDWRQL